MKLTKLQKKNKKPTILLVGVGHFGEKHLETLLALQKKGKLILAGAVVSTMETKKIIAEKYGISVWTELTDDLLAQIDAVDIVTPPETHFDIAMRCLPFTHVMIEKPLAMTSVEAKKIASFAQKHKRILMVGHIYRFNPAVKRLKSLLRPLQNKEIFIRGCFTNPQNGDLGRHIALELPHLFDIVDYIFNSVPAVISTKNSGRVDTVSIKYPHKKHAVFKLGWEGSEKVRTLEFLSTKKEIRCDLAQNLIQITNLTNGKKTIIHSSSKNDPLEEELRTFLKVLNKEKIPYPCGETGILLVETGEKIESSKASHGEEKKPKIAIIGAGIFGASCAIELSKFYDVTIFEKNKDIMHEASFVNQYRHHWGYHYPRSDETVRDIRSAIDDFEELYNDAIIRNFPTYYCIAKDGSKTSAKEYLAFCEKHKLPFTLEYPDKEFLNREKVSISLKTLEPIYDYNRLKDIVHSRLINSLTLKIKLSTSVTGCKITKDGAKELTIRSTGGIKHVEKFDYVINATYASYNSFSKWLGFPLKPVRIDLVEALIVKLPLPKISLAIMDGPFTNLVPTGLSNLFTLVHIKESILERYIPKNGLPYFKRKHKTMVKETIEKSKEWLPILEKAEIVDVRYVFRAVNANREYDDGRPSDITYHGFGGWSILGGKIVNCVSIAKKITEDIKKQSQ